MIRLIVVFKTSTLCEYFPAKYTLPPKSQLTIPKIVITVMYNGSNTGVSGKWYRGKAVCYGSIRGFAKSLLGSPLIKG